MTGPRLRLRPQLAIPAFAAALIALALALPAAASAAPEFALEVEIAGGGEGAVGCEVEGGPLEECEAEYEESTDVTVIAEPETGSEFVEWKGDCDTFAGDECEVEMDAPKAIEVVFELEEFELTVETDGSGEGAVECQVEGGLYELCPESETYPYGTQVTLFAEPEEDSEFVEWSGDCSGVEAECELTIEEPLGVTATFVSEPPFDLTVGTAGTGTGTVECEVEEEPAEECEAEYEEGTQLTLIATANTGSEFKGFSAGSGSAAGCTASPCSFTIEDDSSVTATFNTNPTPPPPAETCATNPALCPPAETCATNPSLCPPPIAGTAKAAPSALVKAGKAQLKLSCTGGACKGTLKLSAKINGKNKVIGKASFSLAAGASTTLKVKLSAPAKGELAKGKTIKAKLSGTGVAAATVKLKPAKKK